MKFTVDKKALLAALSPAVKIIDKRTTIPIHAHVLVEAAEAVVTLTADSLDIRLAAPVAGAGVERPGRITVDGQTFLDIARRMPDGMSLTIDAGDDGKTALRAGRSRFVLPTLDPRDFPETRSQVWTHTFDMPAPALRTIFEQAGPFMANDPTRYYLEGLHLVAAERDGRLVLRATATDGHKLWRSETDLPAGAEGLSGFIVPRDAAAEIGKLAAEGAVSIAAGDRMVAVTFASGIVLTTKLIDGVWPDTERVIPHGESHRITVDRAALREALDRVAIVSDRRSTKLTFADGHLALAVRTDRGEATEEIEIDGDLALVIGFNSQYLSDSLTVLDADRVDMQLGDAGRAAILTSFERPSPLCVVMPVRVNHD